MAFTSSELARIKAELGYNLLTAGADPYVGVTTLFEGVVNSYIAAEVATTSTTAVTAASSATPATLSLASATGFETGQRCVIDVDDRQETATLQSLSGTDATFLLKLAHSGTYPVSVEGPITIAKSYLAKIADLKTEIGSSLGYGALKSVDEVEFYNAGGSYFGVLGEQLMYWRDELASVLGVPNMWRRERRVSSSLSAY